MAVPAHPCAHCISASLHVNADKSFISLCNRVMPTYKTEIFLQKKTGAEHRLRDERVLLIGDGQIMSPIQRLPYPTYSIR